MASDDMSVFCLCPACGVAPASVCPVSGTRIPCGSCRDSPLSVSYHRIQKSNDRCVVCYDAFAVPGLDPGCTQCATVICIDCYDRLESDTCPMCKQPYKDNSLDQALEPRNHEIPGLPIGLGLILFDWFDNRSPKLAREIVSTNAWKSITYEETDLVTSIAMLCRGSEFSAPFPLGLAILAELVSCEKQAKELREDAIRLDVHAPFPASEFIVKNYKKMSLNLGVVLAQKTFWTSPDSSKWLASKTHDPIVAAARYASGGHCEAAIRLVAATQPARLRSSVIEASDHFNSGYADILRADYETEPFAKTIYLGRALDRGFPKAAYPLGVLYAELGETQTAISCLIAALTECYSPANPAKPEPAFRSAEIHFLLGKLTPFNLGCAEVQFRAAATQGHADAARLGARIIHRGSRSNRSSRLESKKMLALLN